MLIQPQKFVRKPFAVEAIEVTPENIEEVARWCGGDIRDSKQSGKDGAQQYIKVAVKRPLNDRQTRAYPGDWVVSAEGSGIQGFKVYTPKAFTGSFDKQKQVDDMIDTIQQMEERAKAEERAEQEETLDFDATTAAPFSDRPS